MLVEVGSASECHKIAYCGDALLDVGKTTRLYKPNTLHRMVVRPDMPCHTLFMATLEHDAIFDRLRPHPSSMMYLPRAWFRSRTSLTMINAITVLCGYFSISQIDRLSVLRALCPR